MAGINVPQYEIYKVGTNKLKYNNWNLNINKQDAFLTNELVKLFESQAFRIIAKILNKPIRKINFKDYICSVVINDMSHFNKATSKNGIYINGKKFKKFVGTTGGIKSNSLLFINTEIYDEFSKRIECGRKNDIPLVPAKYEAYKALSFSSSQPICEPKGILVVKDCFTKFIDDIIYLDNSDESNDSPSRQFIKDAEIENNVSDGFNLCTIDYMKKVSESLGLDYTTNGVCLRNAWLKGMMYPFPIVEFFEKYNNGSYDVVDIWGNSHDIRDIDMIITESSLKLWSNYESIDEYMKCYKDNCFGFSVTKISPHKLDDERELNYQYIQSYDLDDNDIKELCDPTINKLKAAMCGDYESTLKFIGGGTDDNNWQKALQINEYMMKDPYVIDCVHRMIKKKMDAAKIGKLTVNGNYQIASGDPFALMQSICGLEITGLLKANECYSSYWNDLNVNELVIFRSPMTCHNNIRKCAVVNNDDVNYWYQYMDNIMIINGWDTFCQAENGCDWDGDILFSTNNPVLLRKHRRLPAIVCAQNNTAKEIINYNVVRKSNKNGMGNQVGTITNRVTGMIELQANFDKNSEEYKELEYRIECGQLYQQDELDKIKGIIAKPMPGYWYSNKHKVCSNDDFLKSIALFRKPYFMIYVYEDYKRKLNKFNKTVNKKCLQNYGITYDEFIAKSNKTDEEKVFMDWIYRKMPFGNSNCSMNKVCHYVESQLDGYQLQLKHSSDFDYTKLKVKRRCTNEHRQALQELANLYSSKVKLFKNTTNGYFKSLMSYDYDEVFIDVKEKAQQSRNNMKDTFKKQAEEICINDDERLNIILDLCYEYGLNRQFCWDVAGDLICKRLEELNGQLIA